MDQNDIEDEACNFEAERTELKAIFMIYPCVNFDQILMCSQPQCLNL